MSIPHILTEVINRPIMATPLKLQVIMNLLGDRAGMPFDLDLSNLAHMSSAAGTEMRATTRPVSEVEEQEIAVIDCLGSLVARNHGWSSSDGSGMRSYRTLMRDVQSCQRDPSVAAMILDVDSYGGHSAGCLRAANFIRQARQEKPIWAVVDLNAYSAGYALAAPCNRVILTDSTAGVGSIGCIAIHMDVSKWAEKEGLSFSILTFGKYKAEGNMYEPLEKDAISRLQRSVDVHGMEFAQAMAEFRGLKLQQVLDMEARCYSGQDAVDMGLADEIASFDEAVAMLTDEINQKSRVTGGFAAASDTITPEESDMTTRERMEALLAAEDGPQALADMGYITQEAADAASAQAVSEANGLMLEVVDLCELANLPIAQAASMLHEGMSAADARQTIQQLRANNSNSTTVTSTITPLSGDERHGLLSRLEKQYGGAK